MKSSVARWERPPSWRIEYELLAVQIFLSSFKQRRCVGNFLPTSIDAHELAHGLATPLHVSRRLAGQHKPLLRSYMRSMRGSPLGGRATLPIRRWCDSISAPNRGHDTTAFISARNYSPSLALLARVPRTGNVINVVWINRTASECIDAMIRRLPSAAASRSGLPWKKCDLSIVTSSDGIHA